MSEVHRAGGLFFTLDQARGRSAVEDHPKHVRYTFCPPVGEETPPVTPVPHRIERGTHYGLKMTQGIIALWGLRTPPGPRGWRGCVVKKWREDAHGSL